MAAAPSATHANSPELTNRIDSLSVCSGVSYADIARRWSSHEDI